MKHAFISAATVALCACAQSTEPVPASDGSVVTDASAPVDAATPIDAGDAPPADAGSPTDAADAPDGGLDCGTPMASSVTFTASDGMVLYGTFTDACPGKSRPIVVLAHQLCQTQAEWSDARNDWVSAFSARGVATLAFDLRGHGASTTFPDNQAIDLCARASDATVQGRFADMVEDVYAAINYAATSLQGTSVAVIGASIGSNAALVAYEQYRPATFVVALSPGLDYRNIRPRDAVLAYGDRNALLVAAEDDQRSADAVRELGLANRSVMTTVLTTGGHGNAMMRTHPEELTRIVGLVADSL